MSSEKKIERSRDGLWHVAFEPGRVYIRLGQNPGFIMSEAEGREFLAGLTEVLS